MHKKCHYYQRKRHTQWQEVSQEIKTQHDNDYLRMKMLSKKR